MDNKMIEEIILTRSLSKCKEKYLSGELYNFVEQIKLRLMRSFEERSIVRTVFIDQAFGEQSGESTKVCKIREIHNELGQTFIDASEKEDLYWRRLMYDVEREIVYHETLLNSFMNMQEYSYFVLKYYIMISRL